MYHKNRLGLNLVHNHHIIRVILQLLIQRLQHDVSLEPAADRRSFVQENQSRDCGRVYQGSSRFLFAAATKPATEKWPMPGTALVAGMARYRRAD